MDEPDKLAELIRRKQLAWRFATVHRDRLVRAIDDGKPAIAGRFPAPAEQEFVRATWGSSRQVAIAAIPEIVESILGIVAEGVSDTFVAIIEKRCTRSTPPPDTPSNASGAASSSSSPPSQRGTSSPSPGAHYIGV